MLHDLGWENTNFSFLISCIQPSYSSTIFIQGTW